MRGDVTSAAPPRKGSAEATSWLDQLRKLGRAEEGLNLVLPVDRARFDAEARRRGGITLEACWPDARSAVVIADGGPAFFSRFLRRSGQSVRHGCQQQHVATGRAGAGLDLPHPDPLDAFTEARVRALVGQVLGDAAGGRRWRVLFPFAKGPLVLPFQQLGLAAGLPAPGPLGLQIHPTFGPWWAYRALLLSALPLPDGALSTAGGAAPDPCGPCARPCAEACPAAAVTRTGFDFGPCRDRRLAVGSPCAGTCDARASCPVGASERYGAAQIAFHLEASLVSLRRHVAEAGGSASPGRRGT